MVRKRISVNNNYFEPGLKWLKTSSLFTEVKVKLSKIVVLNFQCLINYSLLENEKKLVSISNEKFKNSSDGRSESRTIDGIQIKRIRFRCRFL